MVQWVTVILCCANGKLRTQLIERAITVLLKSQDKIIFHNERGNKEHFWCSMQSSFYLAFSWHQSLCSGHQGWNLSQPVLQGGFAGEGMVRKWRGAAAFCSAAQAARGHDVGTSGTVSQAKESLCHPGELCGGCQTEQDACLEAEKYLGKQLFTSILCLTENFGFSFPPKYIFGFQLVGFFFCSVLPCAFPLCASWFPSTWP